MENEQSVARLDRPFVKESSLTDPFAVDSEIAKNYDGLSTAFKYRDWETDRKSVV